MANWYKKALPYAAGALTGGVMSSFAPTAKYAAAGSAAAGALTNKKNPLAGALQGGVGGAGGSAGAGALKGFTSGTGAGNQAWNAFKGYGSSIPGMGGIGTSNPTGALAKFLTPQSIQNPMRTSSLADKMSPAASTSGLGNAFNRSQAGVNDMLGTSKYSLPAVTPTPVASVAPSSVTNKGINTKNVLGKFSGGQGGIDPTMMIMGAGLPMIAGAMQPEYKAPDLSGTFQNINDKIATNPYRTQAAEYMGTTLQQPIGTDATAANAIHQRNSDAQFDEAVRALDMHFRAQMGGSGNFKDSSAYQDAYAKLWAQKNLNDQARNQSTQFAYDTQQRTQNLAISKELAAMGDEQINVLLAEAGITAQQAMEAAARDAGRGQSMTDFASTIGAELFRRGLGTPQATVTV